MTDRAGASAQDGEDRPADASQDVKPSGVAGASIDLDGLTDHLGYLVRRLQLWIFQDFIKTLSEADIRPAQYSVLTVIGANPGLTQAALGQRLGIERARLARLLDGLEARSLATRAPSTTDRRSHVLHLTPQGQAFLARLKVLASEHEAHVGDKLGPGRREKLVRLLRPLADE